MNTLLSFEFPTDLPPGPNGRGGLLRMHWAKARLIKRKLKDKIEEAITQQDYEAWDPETPVVLVYTRYRRAGPEMDRDNAVSSTKLVTDLLVKHGLFADDNPSIVTAILVHQERDYHQPTRLRVEIRRAIPETRTLP